MPQTLEMIAAERDTTPAILLQAREASSQRLMMAYAISGIFFMLLPGTVLGVWNLISISGQRSHVVSAAWIQAHAHAQIFGWIGTFILGIGFYSIPKMAGRKVQPAALGWIAWLLWTAGVLLRWAAGFYHLYWRAALPGSALMELCAFAIFLRTVSGHRPAPGGDSGGRKPVWVVAVLFGTAGFGVGLLMNLAVACYVSLVGAGPAFPPAFESRFLTLITYAFIVPTVWGFSARWLPVFLGLRAIHESVLRGALVLCGMGVVLAQVGLPHLAPWLIFVAAVMSVIALRLLEGPSHSPKISGVHRSFPGFVRISYCWLLIAAILGVCAARLDHANGWVGAARHALTVGFIAGMVFAVGQRVLPAFAGMRVLYSPRLMLTCLLLLHLGCALRVLSEVLAYESYWTPAWNALPWSAICELAAVTVFAANMLLTFKQPPAHQMNKLTAA